MKPFQTKEPSRAIPALQRIGAVLESLSKSMMACIEEDNRYLWSIERLQAIFQGDDDDAEELALDPNDKHLVKCRDVTQVDFLAFSLRHIRLTDNVFSPVFFLQDLINVRKAYIDALSNTRQRIVHLLHARHWLVRHLKEVEKNDKKATQFAPSA